MQRHLFQRLSVIGVIVAAVLSVTSAQSQQPQQNEGGPGFTRIQGLTQDSPLLPPPTLSGPLIDYREQMRGLVQEIATYARTLNPAFLTVARDAGELMIKRGVQDDRVISPARTFTRSIDGVMFDGVFLGHRVFGQEPPREFRDQTLDRINRAQRNGLPVLIQDYALNREQIDRVLELADQIGVVANVTNRRRAEMTEIPPHPRRPNKENPNNILSLNDVQNFLYISDPSAFGRQDQFALKIHDTNFDLVIVEPFAGRDPLSRRAIETMKYKKLGARRLVFAKMDIGSVASYRYYWQPGWAEGTPSWIAEPFPDDPDRYFAEYWNPGWQQVIVGNPNSFIYGLVAQGYDGVLVEGLRNYLAFEGNVEIADEFAPMGMPEATQQ